MHVLFVARHGCENEIRIRMDREFLEIRGGERERHLTRAVGPKIEEDHGISIADRARFADDRRPHEFVRLAACVCGGERLRRGGRREFGFRFGERAIRKFRALPSPIAVHRVEAADEGCDAAVGFRGREASFERIDIALHR